MKELKLAVKRLKPLIDKKQPALRLAPGSIRAYAKSGGIIEFGIELPIKNEFTVNLFKLERVLKHLKEDVIAFSETPEGTFLSSGRLTFKVGLEEGETCPDFTIIHIEDEAASVPSANLLEGLKKVRPLISKEAGQSLNGVYFEVDGDNLRTVGCDGHFLGAAKIEGAESDQIFGFTLSASDADAVIKLADLGETVGISHSATGVKLTFGFVALYTEGLERAYPRWRSVIPSDLPYCVSLNAADLLAWCDILKAQVSMLFKRSEDKLILLPRNFEKEILDDIKIDTQAEFKNGSDFALKPIFMETLIKAAQSSLAKKAKEAQEVKIKFSDPGRATIWEFAGDTSVYLLTPMEL